MVLKFLGIGKKSGFFLEAPPADSQPAANAMPDTESVKPADREKAHVETKAVLAPTVEQISEATSKSKVVETAKEEAKAVKEEAKAGLAPITDQVSKATSKVKKTLKEATADKKAKAEKGGVKAAKTGDDAVPAPKPEPTLTNFATTLQVNNTPRRRPGPSLDMFKDMAKKVNSGK